MKQATPAPARLTFCGRTFSPDEIQLMRQIASDCAGLGITEIARTICELLAWKRPNGRLKNHECRQLLERLRDRGRLSLPELRKVGPRGPRRVSRTSLAEPQPTLTGSPVEFEPLLFTIVERGQDSRLWNELVDRYHYLGYRVPVGAHLRYLVRSAYPSNTILACLQWSSPAWRMAARDRWIGWSDDARHRNLQLVVNNSRFLILPWVQVPSLASKILARSARQLPEDWHRYYGRRPLLLETLVDGSRFAGTCYRAANWLLIGHTQGRGRMDSKHQAHGRSRKQVYVYPLCRSVQQRLRQSGPHSAACSRTRTC